MKNRTHYVVIPAVNCWELTKQCIESIKSNEVIKFVLIDNGSKDDTPHEAPNIKNLIYLRNEENKGVSAAWNQGIKKALEDVNCGYIYIVNNDIKLREDAFDNLVTYADQAHLGKSDYMLVSSMPFIGPEDQLDKASISFSEGDGGCYSAFMIAPETIEQIGWFDEGFYPAYFEDNDYDYRIREVAGKKATKSTGSQFFNYQSQTTKRNPEVQQMVNKHFPRCRRRYIEKWGGTPSRERFVYPFDKASLPVTHTKQDE